MCLGEVFKKRHWEIYCKVTAFFLCSKLKESLGSWLRKQHPLLPHTHIYMYVPYIYWWVCVKGDADGVRHKQVQPSPVQGSLQVCCVLQQQERLWQLAWSWVLNKSADLEPNLSDWTPSCFPQTLWTLGNIAKQKWNCLARIYRIWWALCFQSIAFPLQWVQI